MEREIKFRRAYFIDEERTQFSHFSLWGVNIGDSFFTSPSQNNYAMYWEDNQYTGLKDKNGIEICEGDIVYINKDKFVKGKHEVWSVEYDTTEGSFIVYNQLNSNRRFDYDHCNEFEDCPIVIVCAGYEFHPEVIGNIYENPELLK